MNELLYHYEMKWCCTFLGISFALKSILSDFNIDMIVLFWLVLACLISFYHFTFNLNTCTWRSPCQLIPNIEPNTWYNQYNPKTWSYQMISSSIHSVLEASQLGVSFYSSLSFNLHQPTMVIINITKSSNWLWQYLLPLFISMTSCYPCLCYHNPCFSSIFFISSLPPHLRAIFPKQNLMCCRPTFTVWLKQFSLCWFFDKNKILAMALKTWLRLCC